ncbi:sensor histidine kinase [Actinomadura sp. WAC 06369]|uniref:sensor histidine kinase n=1 Tax=Actinomadura sp. WAC 06369 TaxID=2203193 RepID=UPI000F7670E1|nr:HAMP domain-containing sensor histidine kinase [Actinomadura sp. WAC 06369]RSN58259.1 two-component sensor histidine kinase [Actinomadura sp. WAC 06369]
MSVRKAEGRVHRPRSAPARGTVGALAVTGPPLLLGTVAAAVVLHVFADARWSVLAPVLAALLAAALGLGARAARRAAERALRPVADAEAQMAEILEAADASRRVRVPPTGDAADRLAARINGVLDRLERSGRQRRAFIADASHELRTPLTGLRTRIELALAAPGDADLPETLDGALRDVERLHRIVDDLLALARLDAGEEPAREPVDLGALVESELAVRTAPVPLNAKVETGVIVEGNPIRLGRLLVNLLANAERHAVGLIEVEVRRDGAEAVLEVRDDGPGIPPADRDRVFERFTRLDSARSRVDGGTGLGLAVARATAVSHGGRLYAADTGRDTGREARGARFVLRLPLLQGPDGRDG